MINSGKGNKNVGEKTVEEEKKGDIEDVQSQSVKVDPTTSSTMRPNGVTSPAAS